MMFNDSRILIPFGGVPKLGVSKNGWFIRKKNANMDDDWGVPLQETHFMPPQRLIHPLPAPLHGHPELDVLGSTGEIQQGRVFGKVLHLHVQAHVAVTCVHELSDRGCRPADVGMLGMLGMGEDVSFLGGEAQVDPTGVSRKMSETTKEHQLPKIFPVLGGWELSALVTRLPTQFSRKYLSSRSFFLWRKKQRIFKNHWQVTLQPIVLCHDETGHIVVPFGN